MLAELDSVDPATGEVTHHLYDRTIDYGAHPNERALSSNFRRETDERKQTFRLLYLDGDSPTLRLCLKTNAQVGLCSLKIFELVFPERFNLLGISQKLASLSKGGLVMEGKI